MIYTDFKGKKLSMLGMGNMRLPVINGDDSQIDEVKAGEIIDKAMESGINYYDTAWGYHGGNSELAVGKLLKKYDRESFYLANKFPSYDVSNFGKHEEIFNEQLKKCQVEYFDFYLAHNVCETNIEYYLKENEYGTMAFLKQMRDEGKIKHLGFSCHGDMATLARFLETFGQDMEFCQLQINWLDWEFQDAKGKVALLEKYNIPVWVMEPVRGGRLINIDKEYQEKMKALHPEWSIAAWAFRFLKDIPNVKVVLSGMTTMEQLVDNLKSYEDESVLTKDEKEMLIGFAREITAKKSLPCTGCRYCTTHCPMELDIPKLIEIYNEHASTDNAGFIAPMYIGSLPEEKRPSACIGCRSCEAVCPQGIEISEMMASLA